MQCKENNNIEKFILMHKQRMYRVNEIISLKSKIKLLIIFKTISQIMIMKKVMKQLRIKGLKAKLQVQLSPMEKNSQTMKIPK